jgi:hypothetical protein
LSALRKGGVFQHRADLGTKLLDRVGNLGQFQLLIDASF